MCLPLDEVFTSTKSSPLNLGENIFNAYLSRQFKKAILLPKHSNKQQSPREKLTGGGRAINIKNTNIATAYSYRPAKKGDDRCQRIFHKNVNLALCQCYICHES